MDKVENVEKPKVNVVAKQNSTVSSNKVNQESKQNINTQKTTVANKPNNLQNQEKARPETVKNVQQKAQAVPKTVTVQKTQSTTEKSMQQKTQATPKTVNNTEQKTQVAPKTVNNNTEQKVQSTPKTEKTEQANQDLSKQNAENNKSDENKAEKPKKKISKKVWIIIACVVFVAVVGITLGLVFGLSPKATKMQPPVVQVYQLSNQTLVHVDANSNATRYDFYIQKKGERDVAYLSSTNNNLSIKSALKTPGEYTVWARYFNNDNSLSSGESEKVTFIYYAVLETPNVSMSSDQKLLVWTQNNLAKNYRVYYGVNSQNLQYFEVPQSTTGANITFDLSKLDDFDAGLYTLYIQAIAQGEYYKNSNLSQSILFEHRVNLEKVKNATFNHETNILNFEIDVNKTKTNKFEIYINDKLVYGYIASAILQNHSVDLTPYLNEVNITSIKIKCIKTNEYMTDSEYYQVQL